ncbi:hypothetical protein ACFFIX_20600 [Metabacillus herbersteinensis]|uniref:Uncharacterized protein n=1 Tax=Metabacillus herbersteinensis TaxID=283816 RepID=A0ABV6GJA7_9BACI
MKKIFILTILIFVIASFINKEETLKIELPKHRETHMAFKELPPEFSPSDIKKKAKEMQIQEEDVPFFCPPPNSSGINKCLTETYQEQYPTNRYKGEQVSFLNGLLVDFANGKKSKSQVIQEIEKLGSWKEPSDEFEDGEVEYLVTDFLVDSFDTDSNLANQIWAERIDHGLTIEGSYFNVVIYYDQDTKKNNVAVIGLSMAYLDPNGWQ